MQSRRIAVAYSGGRDSTALLRAALAAAEPLGIEVVALHVNHGLSAFADEWQGACAAQCRRWARAGLPVRFEARRLTTSPRRGDSIEAWARESRYRALREMALDHGVTMVLLAHHRRDQAETLLLQALRGAGVAGLAGMPALVERDGIAWARPWLEQPREVIDAYRRRHRLKAIDDDSNADPRYARNRLRLGVWPALIEAFPEAEISLSAAATWAQQAMACLDELSRDDVAAASGPKGLDIAAWQRLSEARRNLALRAWLKRECGRIAASSLVVRLLRELRAGCSARWPAGDGELRSHRGWLSFHPARPAQEPQTTPEESLRVTRAGRYPLPGWQGALRFTRVREGGVPLAWLARLDLRARSGGERFQAGLGRPPRSLKLQFQAAGVPAWQREGPLVYAGGQLVFVPGLGIDARVIGMPGQPQVTIAWEGHGAA